MEQFAEGAGYPVAPTIMILEKPQGDTPNL